MNDAITSRLHAPILIHKVSALDAMAEIRLSMAAIFQAYDS